MPLREFVDDRGTAWLVWSTLPRSGANVRAQYANGWLSFQISTGEDRRRLVPLPNDWEHASDDQIRAYLRLARATTETSGLNETTADVAQHRAEDIVETVEREKQSPSSGGVERIKNILSTIRINQEPE